MKYAIVQNGIVVNVVVSDADYAAENGWIEITSGGIGWDYVDGQFVDNRSRQPEPEIVPILELTKEQLHAEVRALMVKIEALK